MARVPNTPTFIIINLSKTCNLITFTELFNDLVRSNLYIGYISVELLLKPGLSRLKPNFNLRTPLKRHRLE